MMDMTWQSSTFKLNFVKSAKILASLLFLSIFSLSIVQCSFAQESIAQESQSQEKSGSCEQKISSKTNDMYEEVTLTDLYETALALNQIKEEAIHIYVEATRLPATAADVMHVHYPKHIPIQIGTAKAQNKKGGAVANDYKGCLEPRRTWLVFYMASMEPIIEMLGHDVDDVQSGTMHIVIPGTNEKKWTPIWNKWAQKVKEMNEHLNVLLPLFDDAPHNNKPIAEQAVVIYNDAKQLESIRKEACKIIIEAQAKGKVKKSQLRKESAAK